MDNCVTSAIEDYIYDLTDPQRNWPEYYFRQVSFFKIHRRRDFKTS